MFDPTAFDNMKTVTEGALYDLDLAGEITIIDRNDVLNIAKMSRQFTISFKLPAHQITATMEMTTEVKHLAAELLPGLLSNETAGCYMKLQFCFKTHDKLSNYQSIADILRKIWGDERKISQTVEYNPLDNSRKIKNVVTVDFSRTIGEAQMDDLVEMIDFMVTTLEQLATFLGS